MLRRDITFDGGEDHSSFHLAISLNVLSHRVGIARSSIVVVVRAEKMLARDEHDGLFIPIEEVLTSVDMSKQVIKDRMELHKFLVPWIKTAGKNQSDCA